MLYIYQSSDNREGMEIVKGLLNSRASGKFIDQDYLQCRWNLNTLSKGRVWPPLAWGQARFLVPWPDLTLISMMCDISM